MDSKAMQLFERLKNGVQLLLIPEIWTVFLLLVGDTPLSAVGIPIAWKHSGAAAIAIPLIISVVLHRRHLAESLKRGRFGLLPTLALGVILAVSLFYTPSPANGIVKVGEFWGLCVTAVLLGALIAVREEHRTLLASFAIICFGVAILGYVEWFTNENLRQLAVLGGGPNMFTRLMFYGGFSALILSLGTKERWHKAIWAAVSVSHLMPMLLAGSRGGILGTSAALGVVTMAFGLRRSKKLRVIAVASLVALGLVLGGAKLLPRIIRVPKTMMRYEKLVLELPTSNSVGGRFDAIQTALEAFRQSPILGLGAGGFSSVHPYKSPHNIIAEVASETGVVGLVLIVILGVVATIYLARILIAHDEVSGWYAGWLLGMLVFTAVVAQVSGMLPDNNVLFFIGGMICASGSIVWSNRVTESELPKQREMGDLSV